MGRGEYPWGGPGYGRSSREKSRASGSADSDVANLYSSKKIILLKKWRLVFQDEL